MPGRYSKQNEIQQLQYEVGNEIKRDAKPIADGVFGNNARHPDMASISNAELDQLYRDRYASNDRQWLMQEAQRDPQQFLDVTDRIGVPDPPQDIHGKPIDENQDLVAGQLQQQAMQNAQQAGMVPPVPPAPPVAAPPLPIAPPPPALGPAPMTPQVPVAPPPIVGGPQGP